MPNHLFGKFFTSKAISLYLVSLFVISLLYFNYAMKWYWIVIGIIEVVGFFYYSNELSKRWSEISITLFEKKIFKTALILRIVVVIFSYFFYDVMTDKPFMFHAADSLIYDNLGKIGSVAIKNGNFDLLSEFERNGVKSIGDSGYGIYLSIIYILTYDSIIIARLLKALLGAYTCLLIYRLASRNFNDPIGRLAAIFCMLMPNLLIYCGTHLKEIEMIFLMVAFVERADVMFRERSFSFKNVSIVFLIIIAIFSFRTITGVASIIAIIITALLSSKKVISLQRKWLVMLMSAIVISLFMGGSIANEISRYWAEKDTNQSTRLEDRVRHGANDMVTQATAVVFAPMIFTLPFPTFVETERQEQFRFLHGGVVVKNITSFFCILAIILLLISGNWRQHVLLGSFLITYLIILAMSAFAHSERFHLPAIPFEMIFVALGVFMANENKKYKKYYIIWLGVMFVAFIAWTWLKGSGRGW